MVAEELLEAEPPEEVVEDRQGGDAAGGQGPAGGVGRLAGSWCGRGAIRPMVRVLIHGSPPVLMSPRGIGRPFRRDLRRHGRPGRGLVKGSKIFGSTYLDTPRRKSRAARLTLPGLGRKSLWARAGQDPGHCPGVGHGEEWRAEWRRASAGRSPCATRSQHPRGALRPDLRSVGGKFRDIASEMCGKEAIVYGPFIVLEEEVFLITYLESISSSLNHVSTRTI